jgi:hypothetical protein
MTCIEKTIKTSEMSGITIISKRLIELVREREFVKALQELFSTEAVSIDPTRPGAEPVKGLSKLIEMERHFLSRVYICDIEVSEAIHAGDYFAIRMFMNFIIEGKERRVDELCVYKVSQGKIVSQQFFIA